ncbi:MAG: N-acetylmuramoyl-L-alanine amidase [Clostridiaceae bacterium]
MKKIFGFFILMVFMSTMLLGINVNALNLVTSNDIVLQYRGHVQDIGWQNWTSNDSIVGTVGKGLRLEALNLKIASGNNVQVRYSAHVQDIGWQSWVQDGDLAGTTGKSLKIEALKVELINAPAGYHIQYAAHVQDIGWQDYVQDGQVTGTTGQNLRLEALKIKIVKEDSSGQLPDVNNVSPSSKIVMNTNYQGASYTVGENTVAGDPNLGLRLDYFSIANKSLPEGTHISYQAHVQDIGWQDWAQDGQIAGTKGQNLRVEAFKIKLVGAPKGYSIKYQAYVEKLGWRAWTQNGEVAGTTGQSLKIKAVKVLIEYNPDANTGIPSLSYQTLIQNQGWQALVSDGQTSGTPGSGLKTEGIKISLNNAPSTMGIKYQAHVENVGWQDWVQSGQLAGTTGQGLRIEGFRVQLTGSTGNYHVLYKAYVEGDGWQNWVKDGEISGVVSKSKRIEAIVVKIVNTTNPSQYTKAKFAIDIGHNAPYDSGATGIRQEDDMTREVGIRVIQKLRALGYNVVEVLPPTAVSLRNSLQQRTDVANANEVNKFVSIHFNKFNGSANGTEVFYYNSSAKGMAQNVLNNITSSMGFYNRGIKYADYYVLRTSNAPAILIEGCFLDSSIDMSKYNVDLMASAIVRGLDQ